MPINYPTIYRYKDIITKAKLTLQVFYLFKTIFSIAYYIVIIPIVSIALWVLARKIIYIYGYCLMVSMGLYYFNIIPDPLYITLDFISGQ